ncbi:hypothetical protein Dsin_028266 [Dipteronia sinensis]|uniref:Reverse transcriptase domain-containing protein n=1 Tax=Dipteronia sinensis TaxID=43782 RepID=A0AAD9ZQW9_9ROSI|nr:hypothetical protein Dsin_028266 [Dipteronia sinensis]
MNDTLVVLIPKKKVTEKMSDYRPISLCNVIYKIVAKTIANQFCHALEGVISDTQSAFIPGRLISDNILVSFECMHMIKRKKRKHGAMAIKRDMSKVCDRVEWIFIERMMRKLGFSDRWISLVMRCISSVSYSFVLNGTVCGLVHPLRGLRQGDPLSPYIFLICAEGFSSLISQAVSMREIRGFQFSRNGPTISHLLFADDSLLFAQATDYNCKSIRRILDTYARASGQVINFAKSAMCVSPSVSSQECTRLAAFIGIGVVDCHESYLGLPCLAVRRKKEIFSGIISKILDKIRGWRDKFLSTGGKKVLIMAVIQAIPTYTMNLFQLPKSLLKEIYRSVEVDVVAWAASFLAEFHDGKLLKDSMPPTSSVRDQKWTPLNLGMYKINCDAAIGSADRLLAIDTGLHPCRIESDAKIVVDWINSGEVLCSEIGNVIADIRSLLENEHCVSLNFVSRKANQLMTAKRDMGPNQLFLSAIRLREILLICHQMKWQSIVRRTRYRGPDEVIYNKMLWLSVALLSKAQLEALGSNRHSFAGLDGAGR